MKALSLLVCLLLLGCNGTGVVRTNLDSPGIAGLRDTAVRRCTGIPRKWPAEADATQAGTEKYIKRDEADTRGCASASLSFIKTISARDKDLTGSTAKKKRFGLF